jgi:hypothetical protein
LSIVLDDSYQKLLPRHYAYFGKDILLIHLADSSGRRLPVHPDQQAATARCLAEVVGNRVYKTSQVEEPPVEVPGPKGTIRKVRPMRVTGGNLGNDKHVTFRKDGSVEVLIGV